MKTRFSVSIAACVAVCVLPALVEATPILLGQTVQISYKWPDLATDYVLPANVVVGAGTEIFGFAGFADIDLSDTNILITTIRNAGVNAVAFDGFQFFDVNGTIPTFSSVTLNPATNYAGFDALRIAFDANNIWLNVANLPGLNGEVISIDIAADVAAVPEPSTLLLLAAGLLAGGRRLRSRRRQDAS